MSDHTARTRSTTSSSSPGEKRRQSPPVQPMALTASKAAGSHLGLFAVSTDALLAEIDAAEHRLSSGLVDLENAASVAGIDMADASVAPFLDLLEAELDRVAGSIASQSESVQSATRALLTSTDCVLAESTATAIALPDGSANISQRRSVGSVVSADNAAEYLTSEALKFHRKASDLASMSLSLNYFARKTAAEFRAIASEADAHLGISCGQTAHRKLTSPVWSSFSLGGNVVAILSDVYCNIRAIEAGGSQKSTEKWVAPANFERLTKKYWVKEEKLAEVMLASVAEVPLLVYGRSGRITPKESGEYIKASQGGRDRLWDSLATPVNSIYFDNETMSLYSDRIKQSKGAQLLRVRWYGEERPRGAEVLFLELKTHHEKWVNTKSVKQRVSICETDMRAMFDESKLGEEWTRDHTEKMVLRADPSLKGDKLDGAVDLLLECRRLVVTMRLRPCVRTKYLRVAFQSSESNSLRLTVDRDITMIDERGAPSDSWCLPDDSTVSARSQVVRAPCAVFEVKLSGSEDPPFIQELDRRRVIMDGHKFSKFLTGAASFNGNRVSKLPYWAKFGAFKPMFEKKEQVAPAGALSHGKSFAGPVGIFQATNLGISRRDSLATAASGRRRSSGMTFQGSTIGSTVMANKLGEGKASGAAGKDIEKSEGRSFGTGLLAALGIKFGSSEPSQAYAQKKPTRVEPKSFFANERTFIQWISAALLMITVSIILFEVGEEDARYMGMILCIIGMVVAVYSLFLYFRRVHLMKHGQPYGYVDHLGPVVLTGAILFGVSAMLYYHARRMSASTPPGTGSTISSVPEKCDMLSIDGVSKLEYQPSDALVDDVRGILLVPSMNQITVLPLDETSSSKGVRVAADIPGTDFEALTYAEDKLYAISEFGSKSELFAFEWTDSGGLSEAGRWELPMHSSAEGMAYVPDDLSGSGKLYIADGGAKERTHIYVYEVPHISNALFKSPLSPVRELNSNFMTKNLEEPKIASLYYFEKVLYVLHDNARVVRGWDLHAGEMAVEFPLPAVSGGFSKQWEGMGLLRMSAARGASAASNRSRSRKQESEKGLRRATSVSSLKLYLALDTPPQVWSIAITEGSKGWSFPDCAKMYQVQQQR